MKRLAVLIVLSLTVVVATLTMQMLRVSASLYINSGSFAGCPQRPSCVSSRSTDDAHRVPALVYVGDAQMAQNFLREVVERSGGKVIDETSHYLHAVYSSPTLQFKDDLELLIHPDGQVDVRSISRIGYDDFGANRARVEQLRRAFEATP